MVDITDDIMECLTDRDLEKSAKGFFEMDSGQDARIPDSIVKVWLRFIRENGLSIEALPLSDPTIEAIGRKFGRPIGDRLVDWPTHGVLVEGTAKLEKEGRMEGRPVRHRRAWQRLRLGRCRCMRRQRRRRSEENHRNLKGTKMAHITSIDGYLTDEDIKNASKAFSKYEREDDKRPITTLLLGILLNGMCRCVIWRASGTLSLCASMLMIL